jgi:transposase
MTTPAPRPEYSVLCKTKAREKGVDAMLIIGCDYHPSFQQIAFCDTATGECGNRRLEHNGEAEAFYRSLIGRQVRVGMEATGGTRWFERLLAECGHQP